MLRPVLLPASRGHPGVVASVLVSRGSSSDGGSALNLIRVPPAPGSVGSAVSGLPPPLRISRSAADVPSPSVRWKENWEHLWEFSARLP